MKSIPLSRDSLGCLTFRAQVSRTNAWVTPARLPGLGKELVGEAAARLAAH